MEERVQRTSLSSTQSMYRLCLGQKPIGTSECNPSMHSRGSISSLPPYIGPLPTLIPKDVEHNGQKGSLLVPERNIQDALLMAVRLLDAKSDGEVETETSGERHQKCMEVLQRLRNIHTSAGFATSFLQAAIQRANVPSEVNVENVKETSGAELTPPHSYLASEQHNLSEKESPSASDEPDESASSAGMVPPDDVNSATIGDTGLDNDFDALFDLDADMGFSATEEDQGMVSLMDTDISHLRTGTKWTPLCTLSPSEIKPSFSQGRLHSDPITNLRIPIQA